MNGHTTYVIELTPRGRAAVAVVLVAGPSALDALDRCFLAASSRKIGDVPSGRIVLGRWGGENGEELIVCRRADDRVEVHCHGGVAAVRAVVDLLAAHGCQPIAWQDWLRTSECDPIRTAARVALAEAPTARTAAILLDQYNGALVIALSEILVAAAAGRWAAAADRISALLAFRDVGQHLTRPWQVVLAGRPNVGKSSLLNALAGFQRAIVSPLPGTTRDVVTLTTAIDGWPVQLADTAGLREAGDDLEVAGIGLAGDAIASADLLVVVHDCGVQSNFASHAMRRPIKVFEVGNKVDLLRSEQHDRAAAPSLLFTSAVTGEGIPELIAAIGNALVPNPPAAGAAVPFTDEQVAALERAREAASRRDATVARASLLPLMASPT